MPAILSLHGDYGISGVSTWGGRIARASHADTAPWHLGVVGLAEDDRARWAEETGAPLDRVHALGAGRAGLATLCDTLGASVIVPNDAPLDDGVPPRPLIALCHGADIGWRARMEPLAPAARGVAYVAAHVRDAMADAFPAGLPEMVQPCGIDMPSAQGIASLASRSGPLHLAWVGRLDRSEKRVQDAVALAHALAGAAVRLHLVGDGPARSEVESAARALGDALTLGPPCPPSCVRTLIAQCDAVVMTSATEGWPTVAMEALAAGRPVICTEGCGGAARFVERHGCGIVTPVADTGAMASAIRALDRGQLAELGARARRHAEEELDVREAARAWDAFVARVLQDQRGAGDIVTLRDPPHARLMRAAIERSGGARVAIYGAGAHTRRVADIIELDPRVACVLDDDPSATQLGRLPIVTPTDALRLGIDAVVCSSDGFEDTLAERARAWWDGPVVRLYERGTGWQAIRERFGL